MLECKLVVIFKTIRAFLQPKIQKNNIKLTSQPWKAKDILDCGLQMNSRKLNSSRFQKELTNKTVQFNDIFIN